MDQAKKERKKTVKKRYWRLHHWVGLYTGLLIGILSLTGALAVFIPEIDSLIKKYHYDAFSTPHPVGQPEFVESLSSLTTQFPNYQSLNIHLPKTDNDVVVIEMVRRQAGESRRYEFFVDGGRDVILGQRLWQNSFANFLRQMHVRLYEGNWGRQLVGIAGIGLVLVSITGLMIYGNFMKKQKWPQVRKKLNMRIQMADWHKIFGVSALAFNLVIAATGAWLGLQPWLMKRFDMAIPNQHRIEQTISAGDDRSLAIDWSQARTAVATHFPGFIPNRFEVSTNGSATITARGNVPGQVYERNTNLIVLSKTDYRPLFIYKLAEQPLLHKFYYIQEALHFGDFGGLGLKVLYAILGLTSGFLSISGFIIFLYRRHKKNVNVEKRTTRMVFFVSTSSLLLLAVIAFISINMGYNNAAAVAEILVNGLLIGLALYLVFNFVRKNRLSNKSDTRIPPSSH